MVLWLCFRKLPLHKDALEGGLKTFFRVWRGSPAVQDHGDVSLANSEFFGEFVICDFLDVHFADQVSGPIRFQFFTPNFNNLVANVNRLCYHVIAVI